MLAQPDKGLQSGRYNERTLTWGPRCITNETKNLARIRKVFNSESLHRRRFPTICGVGRTEKNQTMRTNNSLVPRAELLAREGNSLNMEGGDN